MNEFNFNSYNNSNQTISYCEVDKCKAVIALHEQLDQLKAENEKLKQTLTEIKVLSQEVYKLTNRLNRDMALFAKEIIQKISEVEDV